MVREAQVEYRILGPLEVWEADRRLPVDAPKQRAILAILVLHANRVVSNDRLIDLVWGDEPPDGGLKTLRFHIWKLRENLVTERQSDDGAAIATVAPGYMLQAEPDAIDALRFERLVGEAHDLLSTDPSRSIEMIDEALSLWRGAPLADFTYEEFARLDITRLEELKRSAEEDRIDAALTLGRHAEVIGELRALVDRDPHRERPWGQLMVALYRSGRQAEALDAYQQLRTHLGEGLGIEPSAEVRALEERILLQDEALLDAATAAAVGKLRGYVLHEQLGQGAFGSVWRAEQPGLGRDVAIKQVLPELANQPEFVRRFETEARFVAALEHPHIVSLFDFWRDPEGAYLVMPYLRGGSLGQAIRRGPLPPSHALKIVDEIGAALSYAHRRGVVHQDVSPENVLLDDDGNAYLADLGMAVLVGSEALPPSASPGYAPPERLAGAPASAQSDVFSLGMLAHTMVTGVRAVPDEAVRSVIAIDPGLPGAIDTVIERATTALPENRYPDSESFVAALHEAFGAEPGAAVVGVDVRNPFKGLQAFTETDADDFFGREAFVDELLGSVRSRRLVGVVGPSGCGKSSAVRAGLIPALRSGALPGSDRWLMTDLYPGSRPFEELEAGLLKVAVERRRDFAALLRSDPSDASSIIESVLPAGAELLIVI
ncbi:MAG: BTAD domain-containing putative transcriptional regulator, partial [Acidimicrobiia bacterium]|nr:BTAD domain-containing putative transcriptional regulator [Acidimicrobiia bacterium]